MLFDEPQLALHFDDVARLMRSLRGWSTAAIR